METAQPGGAPRPGALPELRLVVLGGGGAAEHPLRVGELILGRADEADVRIEDASISRRHARLVVAEGRLEIEDLGSSNGTRVRGRALEPGERAEITIGDGIELGDSMIVVRRGRVGVRREAAPGAAAEGAERPVPAMAELERIVERVAPSDLSVLVVGETGVGKEVLSEAIHRRSRRAGRPLLRLNCAAFTETLLESELFGYERGAFSGADETRPGLLETAHTGTVFLDEVGELPASIQAKLLRVLEERRVRRVGGREVRDIDVRFVSATNRDLEAESHRGAFRLDLYYRLNGITLAIPPLRERTAEIRGLAVAFAERIAERLGQVRPELSTEAIAYLEAQPWPGNIRELKNAVERAVVLADAVRIEPAHFGAGGGAGAGAAARAGASGTAGAPLSSEPRPGASSGELKSELEAIEKKRILEALERAGGSQRKAAQLLGMARGTLLARLDAYGVPRPKKGR
jgi:transcriptional regulator with GAF, ATPase, and Fis domain